MGEHYSVVFFGDVVIFLLKELEDGYHDFLGLPAHA